jgi:serine protease inhibitor
LALHRHLAPGRGNLFFSPYSIATALAMAQAGAAGTTRQEIEAALGDVRSGPGLVEHFGALARELARLSQAVPQARFDLLLANTVWSQSGYPLVSALTDKLRSELRAEVEEVDEQGTEAAAVTVAMSTGAAAGRPPEPIEFRVDRPFLFVIHDKPTGTVLFLGRVVDPGQSTAAA